jgi:endo-1,4-beta-mannosidase
VGSDRDRLLHGGRPWLGVNFWSRAGGPLMWRGYDPGVVREELATLASNRINLTRSFCYWPDFHPEPDRLDEAVLARFADFLDAHTEAGMATVPTFIVGHMSGENWDPAWRQGRDLYGDVWMVARQAWYVREVTRRFAGHPAVAGWLLSNEMPLYGGPAPEPAVTAWAELLVQAVRAGGGTQPVSLGDGAWGIELTGTDNGFSVRATAGLVDFLGPHVYRMDNDRVRLHLGPAFACELAGFAGKPVVLEEFGVSTGFSSATNAGHYYRQVLHTSLLAGASGWIAWNNTDYDHLADQDPYRHHPFEMRFGLTDHTGRPKPHLGEVRAFGELLETVDAPNLARPPAGAALVVSSYLERPYPFTEPEDRTFVLDSLRQAYVAAWEADLAVRPMRELDGLRPGARLYLVPSAKQLTAPGWRALEGFAADGAVVYVSFSAGGHGVQRGPWHAGLDEMFGVAQQLTHGLVDPIEDEEVVVTFVRDFGSIPEGSRLELRVGGSQHVRAYLPVRPVTAEVVAVDGHDRPVLVERAAGRGRLVLCTYPLEQLAAASARVNPEPTWRIYDALATVAALDRPVTVEDPRVMAAELRHADGRSFVWLISQSDTEVTVKPTVKGRLADLHTGLPADEVTLDAYGVRVLQREPSTQVGSQ